jgi:hypothetical protein
MGYVAIPFAVDLSQVRQVLGCKDLALLEKVKSCALYETYASQTEGCDFDEVLEDLIVRYIRPADRKETGRLLGLFKGKPSSGLNPDWAHNYGYAMLTICDTLGTFLSPQGDVFYAGRIWKEVNRLFKNKGIAIDLDRMWQTEKLFDVPAIVDFPVISHYSRQEVNYLLTALGNMSIHANEIENKDVGFDELQELLIALRDGLQVCKDKDVEWVSFLH